MSTVRRRAHVGGFTLIEVLVALTIAAVALMASVRATTALRIGSADLRDRGLAQWSAENRLAQIRITNEFPALGRRQYDCSQAGRALVCVDEVFATPNRFFRRVQVSVLDRDGHRLARLIGFATQGI
ncbi:MAG: type II secretion system minor pseudopilin GspI [Burkholderiaceae bacterium]|nr:type II secretion system minor pseudopilin GspI [Burkholderiaceae bacterium]